MRRNVRLILAYDGTDFHGWQRQPGVRTVQQEVEAAVLRVVRHLTAVIGASRTDAGVHALGQTANFQTDSPAPLNNLQRAISHRLPADVAVVRADEVPPDFHASLSAMGKRYQYRIFNSQRRPVERLAQRYVWHVWTPLDLDRMREAASAFVGTHDFAGFATAGSPRQSTVRTVTRVTLSPAEEEVRIDVEGDGFLYNQVRNMVGTLVEIGRGHWPVERVRLVLASRDRRDAGPTAPPQGLTLHEVQYPELTPVGE